MRRKFTGYLLNRVYLASLLVHAAFILFILAASAVSLAAGGYYFLPALSLLAYILLASLAHKWISLPYRETEKLLSLFADGLMAEDAFNTCLPYSWAAERAMARVQEMIKTDKLISAGKRQAQFLALQNQINPHFLYNALEGIRSDALAAGLTSVANATEALGTFFRYTISNIEKLVTLEEELSNVSNYFVIQRYRFGDRMSLNVEFDCGQDREALLKSRLPKLTLQPVVENAIIHGIERKVGEGSVTIKVLGTPQRIIVTISDDGLGIGREALESLNQRLSTFFYEYINEENDGAGGIGGIALVNVNNRIRLLFGEAYGLTVYSTPGVGTDVDIALPYIYNA